MFWGAFDLVALQQSTPGYGATQIVTGGTSAVVGSGVGVRRATLLIDRSIQVAGSDPMFIHFDFLNMTSGSPDDTWITTDFTALETLLATFITTVSAYWSDKWRYTQVAWHRVGTGIGKPNPAERTLILTTPIAGSIATPVAIPQAACSITFRTGVRASWGRTYLPYAGTAGVSAKLVSTTVDAICTAAHTLAAGAAAQDFYLVVTSLAKASTLNVEKVEVDDIFDVIRRRRWKQSTYRKLLP